MRKLRVRCQLCGEVVVSAGEIVLAPGAASYAFRCPLCRLAVRQPCAGDIARLLLLNGARTEAEPVPVPAVAPEADNPVLDLRHIAELSRLLERPDWLTLLRNVGA